MELIKIQKLIKEIELLNLIDEKFKINHWYKYIDTYRNRTDIFKVLDLDTGYVYFESLDGELEKTDPQEVGNAFGINSLTYQKSEELNKEYTKEFIIKQIKELTK